MSVASPLSERLSRKSALLVGLGGLGCPAALALARAGVGRLILVDDDLVDLTNLHRQILYLETDVGRHKLDAAKDALGRAGAREVVLQRTRLLPETARGLIASADVVLEGSDNFATKFLAADAAHLEGKPIVHGAAVRLHGTAWLVNAGGAPCYRCLFEDLLPEGSAPNCSEAGVLGPVVGIVGALMADLALDVLLGETSREGTIFSYDGKRDRLRSTPVTRRADCPLCGERPLIHSIEERRYYEPTCPAAPRVA
jgi:molybdopterin/thiamine biosynthesis adenylyltransferase